MKLQGVACHDILDLDGKALISRLKSTNNLVLLVGSIISEWHPSNLPSGATTTRQIASLLASSYPLSTKHEQIAGYIARAPFEYILDRCPDTSSMRSILQAVYDSSTPNAAHIAIANLVGSGSIHSVITPNYDLCLDGLLPDRAPLKHVVEEPDSLGLGAGTRILFKIHGCASLSKSASMVLTLSEEGVLPRWKQDVLAMCLEGKTLLVMGFSGLDFEISPYILKANFKEVIWNSFRDPCKAPQALSPNALRIVNSSKAEVIHGDLRHLLGEWDALFRWSNPSASMPDVGKMFSGKLSKDDVSLWSASVLSSPGYARFAEELSAQLAARIPRGTEQWATSVFLTGDAQYSSGRYSDCSSNAMKASNEFRRLGRPHQAIISAAKSVDALRCIGRVRAALRQLQETRALLASVPTRERDRLRVKLELQEVLILREQYSRAKILARLGLRQMAETATQLKDQAHALLKSVCEVSELYGQWHDLQQCRMWSNRLDIPFSSVYSGDLQPLEDLAGWSHLGHMVPEMMSLRGALLKGRYDEAPLADVVSHIRIAEEIGCNPEVWKLWLSKWRHYGFGYGDSIIGCARAFFRCHYTLAMRAFKLLFEEYR